MCHSGRRFCVSTTLEFFTRRRQVRIRKLLEDGLRGWPAAHPAEAAIVADRPRGPLAITHRTGKRRSSPGTGRHFDSIWLTEH